MEKLPEIAVGSEAEIIYLQYEGEIDESKNIVLQPADEQKVSGDRNENGAPCGAKEEFTAQNGDIFFPLEQQSLLDSATVPRVMFVCRNADDSELNKFQCRHCALVVGCVFCLKSHFESAHLDGGPVQYRCSQTIGYCKEDDVCPKCGLVCKSKQDLLDHRKVHFARCEICDAVFDSPLHLSNHFRNDHKRFDIVLSCDLCTEWCHDVPLLSDHYETAHGMILCVVCLKRFATKAELEAHHGSHSIVLGVEPVLPFACSKCDTEFETIGELSKHLVRGDGPRCGAGVKRKATKRTSAVKTPKKTYS